MTPAPLPDSLPCPKCEGAGTLPNPAKVGPELRLVRKQARISLRQLGAQMGLSATYIKDLEHGRKAWTASLIDRYQEAVIALTKNHQEP